MALLFVNSVGGSATAPYDTWAKGALTLAVAAAAAAAGDDIYVAQDHAETQASAMVITFPGTVASPNRIICANRAGAATPTTADMRTTGTVTTTGSFGITLNGSFYCYGVTFNAATTGSNSNLILGFGTTNQDITFDTCGLWWLSASASFMNIGTSTTGIGLKLTMRNTTIKVGNAGSAIQFQGVTDFVWKDTASAIQGATLPTNLFGPNTSTSRIGTVIVDGVDLSAMVSKTLVSAQTGGGLFVFKDCKKDSTTVLATAPASPNCQVYEIRSDSGAHAYSLAKSDFRGLQSTELTIVRTGGKSINGTAVAMKLKPTSNALFVSPFESAPMIVNNAVTGSNVTVTVYGVWAGGAIPKNDELWLEIGYLGSSASPLLTFDKSTKKATVLDTGAAVAVTDASTWGGSTTKFKWVVTLSSPQPGLTGEMYIKVFGAGHTNDTYIDPLPVLS